MRINPSIFKSYDIRGSFPEEINERAAYLIAFAFSKFLGEETEKVAVGMDNRESSPIIKKAVVKGLMESGKTVVDLGLCPTPLFYFTVAHYGFDGGIQVTGSHLGPGFNGLKIVKEGAVALGKETGLLEIKEIIEDDELIWSGKKEGRVIKKDATSDYVDFNLKDFGLKEFKPLKVVVDTGNSVGGKVVPAFFNETPLELIHLFPELDSSFPNRPLNPLEKGARKAAQKKMKQEKADLGAVFDGDGDRIMFIDERGEVVPSDLVIALVGSLLLSENPGEKVVFAVNSSKLVEEAVKEAGGKPVRWKVGHTNIKRKMMEDDILFGGECSGHFFLRSHHFVEAPFFVLLAIANHLSKTKKTFSEVLSPFKGKYFHSGEINFEVEDKKSVLSLLEEEYGEGKVSNLDGVRIEFDHWWFSVRPSKTEDLLRLVLEADDREVLKEKKEELTRLITGKKN